MAIEIVDFPIKKNGKNVIFHTYVSLPEGRSWFLLALIVSFATGAMNRMNVISR